MRHGGGDGCRAASRSTCTRWATYPRRGSLPPETRRNYYSQRYGLEETLLYEVRSTIRRNGITQAAKKASSSDALTELDAVTMEARPELRGSLRS